MSTLTFYLNFTNKNQILQAWRIQQLAHKLKALSRYVKVSLNIGVGNFLFRNLKNIKHIQNSTPPNGLKLPMFGNFNLTDSLLWYFQNEYVNYVAFMTAYRLMSTKASFTPKFYF